MPFDNSLVSKFPDSTDGSFKKLHEIPLLNREYIVGDTVYILIFDHLYETDLNRLKLWIAILIKTKANSLEKAFRPHFGIYCGSKSFYKLKFWKVSKEWKWLFWTNLYPKYGPKWLIMHNSGNDFTEYIIS